MEDGVTVLEPEISDILPKARPPCQFETAGQKILQNRSNADLGRPCPMSAMPANQYLPNNDLLMILIEKVQRGDYGPFYEIEQVFSGHPYNPVQVVLRDTRSLLVELVNVNRNGTITWGKNPFVM